jgi:hypothetical protein
MATEGPVGGFAARQKAGVRESSSRMLIYLLQGTFGRFTRRMLGRVLHDPLGLRSHEEIEELP